MNAGSALVEQRLTRIERRQRILGAVGILLGVVLFSTAALRTPADEHVVRVRRLQLVDATGRVWIDMRHDSAETGMFVRDASGDTRIGIGQFAHGGSGVALHGPEMKGVAVLYLRGEGNLTFNDGAGAVTARIP